MASVQGLIQRTFLTADLAIKEIYSFQEKLGGGKNHFNNF